MKKIIMMCIIFSMVTGSALAGSVKCTVVDIDDSILPESQNKIVTLECKEVDKFVLGQKVKVKLPKTKAIEGC